VPDAVRSNSGDGQSKLLAIGLWVAAALFFYSWFGTVQRSEPDVNGQVDVLGGGQRWSSLVANKSPRVSCLLSGGAVGESVAIAGGGDDVGVVAEPVEQ
jgi:hypothetical protein